MAEVDFSDVAQVQKVTNSIVDDESSNAIRSSALPHVLAYLSQTVPSADMAMRYADAVRGHQDLTQVLKSGKAAPVGQLELPSELLRFQQQQICRMSNLILLHNLTRSDLDRDACAATFACIAAFLQPQTITFERGDSLHYLLSVLRNVVLSDKSLAVKLMEEENQWKCILAVAVTNRVVRVPSGAPLIIHFSAIRVILAIVKGIVLPTSEERLDRLCPSLRPIADASAATKSLPFHLELSEAMERIVQICGAERCAKYARYVCLAQKNLVAISGKALLGDAKANAPMKVLRHVVNIVKVMTKDARFRKEFDSADGATIMDMCSNLGIK